MQNIETHKLVEHGHRRDDQGREREQRGMDSHLQKDRRITDSEIEIIVERAAAMAARKAVNETFAMIGVDVSKPFEAQADFSYLRKMRVGSTRLQSHIVLTAITLLIAGVASAITFAISHRQG